MPVMNPTFAAAVAVDAGNVACRKRGGKPSNSGPWPASEWNANEWLIYNNELIKCWRMFEPALADAMQFQLDCDKIKGKYQNEYD